MDIKLLVLVTIVWFVFFTKPSIIFKENSEPRQYGLGTDSLGHKKTLFTMEVLIVLLVISFVSLKKTL